eukprot:TRINITY_DN6441_c0_g1_i1.p1 TRINITY_DN6441_c0_g1~~TRINITY_DN6441_c0_g1_i1.p1  ORF type:complete len:700 (+),score=233.92 TRINITY_DN6441_c0_g1_i1:35-2134(+)
MEITANPTDGGASPPSLKGSGRRWEAMALESLVALGEACSAPIGDSQLAKVCEASTDAAAVREFALAHAARYRRLLQSLVATLNGEVGIKKKTTALLSLANFAKQKPARGEMFSAVKQLDTQFEKTLSEKEQAHASFGSALGKLHETTIVLLMRIDGYRLRGAELLEFADGSMSFAVEILLGMFKVPSYEPEITANCCSALCDLSHPATAITISPGEAVAEHSFREFRERVDSLVTCVMRNNVAAQATTALLRLLRPAATAEGGPRPLGAPEHSAVLALCRMIQNLYTFASVGGSSVALRQSILVSTELAANAIPMYLATCLAQMDKCMALAEGRVLHPVPAATISGAAQALRFISFASFHMGQHSAVLRRRNTWTAFLLQLPLQDFIVENIPLYALLLHSNVNIDALTGETHLPKGVKLDDSCRSATILHLLARLAAALPRDALERLWVQLGRLSATAPLARDNLSFDILSKLFDTALRRDQPASPAAHPAAIDDQSLDQLTDELDRHMLQLQQGRDDIAELREELQQLQQQAAAARKAGADPPTPAEPSELRLLGDLPPLCPSTSPVPGGDDQMVSPQLQMRRPSMPDLAGKIWDGHGGCNGGSTGPIPAGFQCALNGHLLKQPMRAPNGNVYEKTTIESWLKHTGSFDPLTGEPLTADQLTADEQLVQSIVDWQIKQTLAANTDTEGPEESALYAF